MKYTNMLTENEAKALQECVEYLPANPVIVQIGANEGLSTVAMISARPDAFIFSIDLKPYPQERQNLIDEGLNYQMVVRILENSQDIEWPISRIDMIYFDGDHRYNGIKADCTRWLWKIKLGGLAVFHDYIPKNAPPKNQVFEVVNEFFNGRDVFIREERIIGFRIGE